MSNRERWIVYPLLFFALAISLRDKIFPGTVRGMHVECEQLTVHDRASFHHLTAEQVQVQRLIRAAHLEANQPAPELPPPAAPARSTRAVMPRPRRLPEKLSPDARPKETAPSRPDSAAASTRLPLSDYYSACGFSAGAAAV